GRASGLECCQGDELRCSVLLGMIERGTGLEIGLDRCRYGQVQARGRGGNQVAVGQYRARVRQFALEAPELPRPQRVADLVWELPIARGGHRPRVIGARRSAFIERWRLSVRSEERRVGKEGRGGGGGVA